MAGAIDRAGMGRIVRDRLCAVPGIRKAPLEGMDLFVLRGFMTAKECEKLIRLIDTDRKPSRLFAENPDPEFRTSETCNLNRHDPVVKTVETRIDALLGFDLALGEPLQGQRYQVGQQFKPHHDYLRTGEAYWQLQNRVGGQRTWTAMAFLNMPESGGETCFPCLDLTVPPRPGSLVVWNNLDPAGEPNPATLHQGRKVERGVKYIVTKWYRERPWGIVNATSRPVDL